jgi:hypothetical protein
MGGAVPRWEDADDGSNRIENNVMAYRGEILFARLFGLDKPTLNVLGDSGVDAWVGDLGVDVKVSRQNALIFDKNKFAGEAAVAFQQTEKDNVLKLMGWITKADFYQRCYSHDYGHGERDVVKGENLERIETLWREGLAFEAEAS